MFLALLYLVLQCITCVRFINQFQPTLDDSIPNPILAMHHNLILWVLRSVFLLDSRCSLPGECLAHGMASTGLAVDLQQPG